MKSIIIKSCLAAAVTLSVFASSAFAADGVVNFTGNITDTGCVIDTASKDQTVALGNVAKSAFAAAGDVAAAKSFQIKITSCPAAVTGAVVRFDGNQVVGDNSVLALTEETGVATGVGIQMKDNKNNIIKLYENSTAAYDLATTGGTLDFTARYIATSASVVAGKANSTTNFTIIYP